MGGGSSGVITIAAFRPIYEADCRCNSRFALWVPSLGRALLPRDTTLKGQYAIDTVVRWQARGCWCSFCGRNDRVVMEIDIAAAGSEITVSGRAEEGMGGYIHVQTYARLIQMHLS